MLGTGGRTGWQPVLRGSAAADGRNQCYFGIRWDRGGIAGVLAVDCQPRVSDNLRESRIPLDERRPQSPNVRTLGQVDLNRTLPDTLPGNRKKLYRTDHVTANSPLFAESAIATSGMMP